MKRLRKAREVVGKKKAREGMQKDFESRWHDVAEEVMSGMREWRIEHPRATLRILDFPHAGEYLNEIVQGLWGENAGQKEVWLHEQLHHLKEQGATVVLATLRQEIAKKLFKKVRR